MKKSKLITFFTVFLLVFMLINSFFDSDVGAIDQINYDINTTEIDKVEDGKLFVKFYNMENGDCTFIKYGNIEILVDAGDKEREVYFDDNGVLNTSKKEYYDRLKRELKDYVSDGVLDYLFVSHGDADHAKNVIKLLDCFDSNNLFAFRTDSNKVYEIDNLVDFDTQLSKILYQKRKAENKNTDIYDSYVKKRDSLVDKGINNYYSVDQILEFNSSGDFHELSLSNELSIYILKNKYYYVDNFSSKDYPAEPNLLSLCLLVKFGESKVLLTGDLEKDGENDLVDRFNNSILLDGVTLFKAGHHGSRTSNNANFVDMIRPKHVMITCAAGGQYNFPNQNSIDNFLTYTDYIYFSSYKKDNNVIDMYHGDVTFLMDEEENVKVRCENKDEENTLNLYYDDEILRPITETTWFKNNRSRSLKTFVFSGYVNSSTAYVGNCTLLKYGHYDILIDCGNNNSFGGVGAITTKNFVEKVEQYCVDGIIECLIVTSPSLSSISQLVDSGNKYGIFSVFEVKEIIDFGDFENDNDKSDESSTVLYSKIREKYSKNETYFVANELAKKEEIIKIGEDINIHFLKNSYADSSSKKRNDSPVVTMIDFGGVKSLFNSDISEKGEESILENNSDLLSNISFFLASNHGHISSNSSKFLNAIGNYNLTIAVNTILGEKIVDNNYMTKFVIDNMYKNSRSLVVTTMKITNKTYKELHGDIIYVSTISSKNNNSPNSGYLYGDEKGSGVKSILSTDYYKNLDK